LVVTLVFTKRFGSQRVIKFTSA